MKIWVDADACPRVIKQIIYRAAERLKVEAVLVANSKMAIPESPLIRLITVAQGFNGADEFIAKEILPKDLLVTADIPLAAKVVAKGALALDPRGQIYSDENIGDKLATRNLMEELRSGGLIQGGPAGFNSADTNKFSAGLDKLTTRLMRES